MNLRSYQIELIEQTRQAFTISKRVLSVLPCGAGKTFCFADMCQRHLAKSSDNYVWFLVHRQELVEQTVQTFHDADVPLDNVLIAMVQTVSRHIERYHAPSMIIFDEAHHATSATWRRITDAYPNTPVIGLTATPIRLDGKPLGDIFDSLVVGVDSEKLINDGYLAPYDYYAPNINLADSTWKMHGADYDLNDVAEQFDKQAIYGDVLKYIDINRKTIIYCPNIAFSKRIAQRLKGTYNEHMIEHFDGTTPEKQRKDIVDGFKQGNIRILLNVDLIGEGFDVPDCDCVMLLRPTMSTGLFIQQSMRCLRPREGKRALIYDFVGNVFRHGMPTERHEWTLDKRMKPRNASGERDVIIRECKSCYRVYKGVGVICPYCGNDNGMTREQLRVVERQELEKIEALQKKRERMEVGMCRSYEALVMLARKRGYKNPSYWANTILHSRRKKI